MDKEKYEGLPKGLKDDNAREYYLELINDLETLQIKVIHRTLLVTLCNLKSRQIELERLLDENGYSVVNVNSRGGQTYLTNPDANTYLKVTNLMLAIQSKLKLPPKDQGSDVELEETDDFDECFE